MRYLILTAIVFIGSWTPLESANAHFGLAGDEEIGHGLLIGYCLLLICLASFVVYRKWLRTSESSEQRVLKRDLRELRRAHNSCKTQLQNAEDYPKECGLTEAERLEREKSVTLIQRQIDEAEAHLAAA